MLCQAFNPKRMGGLLCLLGLALGVLSCSNGGESGHLTTGVDADSRAQRQAVMNLLDLYRSALIQEDIDRLQDLLQDDGVVSEAALQGLQTQPRLVEEEDLGAFRTAMSATFRDVDLTDLQIPEPEVDIAPDGLQVTFLEVESVEDGLTLEQRTQAFRTTFWLLASTEGQTHTIRIAAVRRTGPIVSVMTPGRVVSEHLARVVVTEVEEMLPLHGVEVIVPETDSIQTLEANHHQFYGVFTPPDVSRPQALRVRLQKPAGDILEVTHHYRVRRSNDGVLQPISGLGAARFASVIVAPNGTAWFGGVADVASAAGKIAQVAADGESILRLVQPIVANFPATQNARIADIAQDQQGRLHFLFLAQDPDGGVVGNGVMVLDPTAPTLLCQTVNVLDPAYPFTVTAPETGTPHASPSTRVVAASGADIWLFGSDGGVARVADTFRGGDCPDSGVTLSYDPIVRRESSGLPTNTVPALVVEADGTLVFGTALGVVRSRDGQLTPIPFDPTVSFRGNATTLETFFQQVAAAIFEARPLSTVAIGGISFTEAFGRELIKEDLAFSAVEAQPGDVWIGTFGGGLRRLEGRTKALHLTRRDGLSGNIILALAVGPDGAVWAATEEGVSRIRATDREVEIANFTAFDGLVTPVFDVGVSADGIGWLATAGGAFRLSQLSGVVRGIVRDINGDPIVGADVLIEGTAFRTVTDAAGHFDLVSLPLGSQQLQVDGTRAVSGPFSTVVRPIVVTPGEPLPLTVDLVSRGTPGALRLTQQSGDGQTAQVDIPLTFPLTVRVENAQSEPVAGASVIFSVRAGTGVLNPGTAISNAAGAAASVLTITAPGQVEVEARIDDQTAVIFTAHGIAAGAEVNLIQVSGNNQVVPPGLALPEPLVVRLEDQLGTPVTGAAVTASIRQGDAEFVSTSTVLTDGNGEATFELKTGSNPDNIVVEIASLGQSTQFSIKRFAFLTGITTEADGSLVVVDEQVAALIRINPTTGSAFIVSDADTGSGAPLVGPIGIDVAPDQSLVVTDPAISGILRVDPVTGDRIILSGGNSTLVMPRGVGPSFGRPTSVVVEPSGGVVVADGLAGVVRIEPVSGDRTILSGVDPDTGALVGNGPPLAFPLYMTREADGTLAMTDGGLRAVFRIDPVSGDRVLISGGPALVGSGAPFVLPAHIISETPTSLVLVDQGAGTAVQIDTLTGNRTILSDFNTGTGPPLVAPIGITAELSGSFAVSDIGNGEVLRIDPTTGNRTRIIGSGVGHDPASAAVEATGAVVVADTRARAVFRVAPTSGMVTLVSGGDPNEGSLIGAGPAFVAPTWIVVEATGTLVVADPSFRALFRVDPISGDRTVLSGVDASTGVLVGVGPALQNPFGVARDPADGSLVVTDFSIGNLIRVDPVSGDRTLVTDQLAFPSGILIESNGSIIVQDVGLVALVRIDPETGTFTVIESGAAFGVFVPIALEANGDIVIASTGLQNVLRMNLTNAMRTVVSGVDPSTGALVGSGPPLSRPTAIAVLMDRSVVVGDLGLQAVVRIDPVSGDRIIIATFGAE